MSDMQFKIVPVSELRPAEYNPRKALQPGDKEYEKIKRSIQEFGYVDPIIVNYDGTVIGGHQRLTVLKDLGYTEVQVAEVRIESEAKVKALNVALNKISGEWDEVLLADLLADIQNSDVDVEVTGFEPAEIDQLFSEVHDKDIGDDNFDVDEELAKPATAMAGDIWMLGRHRVMCADATKEDTWEALMDGRKANLCVTDPPYNVNYKSPSNDQTIQNDNMDELRFEEFLTDAFNRIADNMEMDASIYVFHSDSHGLAFRKAFDKRFYLSVVCIWNKSSLVLGRSPYQWKHEPILYGWQKDGSGNWYDTEKGGAGRTSKKLKKGDSPYQSQTEPVLFGWQKKGKHRWYADRTPTTVWDCPKPTHCDLHPTMKPIPLMAYPIKNSSMSNCIVVDPFLGSGSTLMACEATRRICYGFELDPKYMDVIVERYIASKGTNEQVFVLRDGQKYSYAEVHEEV